MTVLPFKFKPFASCVSYRKDAAAAAAALDSERSVGQRTHTSKVGSAYICKICQYIDLCMFCILIAYFLHILLHIEHYFCIFFAYNLQICYVEVYVMAYFLHIFFAYLMHI